MDIELIRIRVQRIGRVAKLKSDNARDLQRWLYEDFIDYVSNVKIDPQIAGLAKEVLKAAEIVYTPSSTQQ